MDGLSPFALDTRPRRSLTRKILRLLRRIEVRNPDLVPVIIPTKKGPRVVILYLADATFIRLDTLDATIGGE